MKRIALPALLLLGYLASGLYFVQPDEQAVVRRYGAIEGLPREPGAHWGLPWGFDRIDRLRPREIKRVILGPAEAAQDSIGATSLEFLSGDRNLVNVRASVQFSVKDPSRYLFETEAVDRLVATAAQSALTEILAGRSIDPILTLGKSELGIRLAERLQQLTDRYGLGIMIRSVDIGAIEPPAEVSQAFDNVTSAQRQREQAINQAHSAGDKMLAQARGEAQQQLDRGRADHDQLVRQSQGEAERFESLRVQYERAPQLTANRLYLETMAEILPKFRSKLIVDSSSGLDLSIFREEKQKP
jgi:membrane protease subunit HflK